ncbi:MAG: hypothetical protein WKF77_15195 [Planctomycetaceae bacterium]
MLKVPASGDLDFVSLGALVNRLDPGIIPFRKASRLSIHVSGGEFNCAANLADCFQLKTGIATAMVDYPLGDLIAERVRAMGVKPFYKKFAHDGVRGPNMATVYSDQGHGVRSGRVLQPQQRSSRHVERPVTSTGRKFSQAAALVSQWRNLCGSVTHHSGSHHRRYEGSQGRRCRHFFRPELPRQALADQRRAG